MAVTFRSVAASRTRSGASSARTARRLLESTILSMRSDHDLVERVLDDALPAGRLHLGNQVAHGPLLDDRVHGYPFGIAQRGHGRSLQRRQQREDLVEVGLADVEHDADLALRL